MFNSKKIRVQREKRKLSYYDLQKQLYSSGIDVSHETIRAWENNVSIPRVDQLLVLSELFNKPFGYFFNLKKNKTSSVQVFHKINRKASR